MRVRVRVTSVTPRFPWNMSYIKREASSDRIVTLPLVSVWVRVTTVTPYSRRSGMSDHCYSLAASGSVKRWPNHPDTRQSWRCLRDCRPLTIVAGRHKVPIVRAHKRPGWLWPGLADGASSIPGVRVTSYRTQGSRESPYSGLAAFGNSALTPASNWLGD